VRDSSTLSTSRPVGVQVRIACGVAAGAHDGDDPQDEQPRAYHSSVGRLRGLAVQLRGSWSAAALVERAQALLGAETRSLGTLGRSMQRPKRSLGTFASVLGGHTRVLAVLTCSPDG